LRRKRIRRAQNKACTSDATCDGRKHPDKVNAVMPSKPANISNAKYPMSAGNAIDPEVGED